MRVFTAQVNLRAVFRFIQGFPSKTRQLVTHLGLGGALAAAASCSLPSPDQGTPEPPIDGAPYPFVARASFKARHNHTDLLTIDVTFPSRSNTNGAPESTHPTHPVAVLLQDKGVPADQYRWLADQIASLGFFVATPHHERDNPALAPDDAADTVDFLASPPNGLLQGKLGLTDLTLIGHGEGGRIAVKVLGDRGYTRLALLAAKPDAEDGGHLAMFGRPWAALLGGADCRVQAADVEKALAEGSTAEEAQALVRDHVAVLPGVAHEQFSDRPGVAQGGGCPSPADTDTARSAIAQALRAFLLPADNADGGSPGSNDGGLDAATGDAADGPGADALGAGGAGAGGASGGGSGGGAAAPGSQGNQDGQGGQGDQPQATLTPVRGAARGGVA